MAVAGNIVRTVHLYLDINDAPLTGQTSPANITFQLMRDSGTGMVAAGETITFSETATPGYYNISFTPVNTGLYTLFGKELAGGLRQPRWDFQILAAGAIFAPSYQNAFCAESDIERYLLQPIDANTKPNDVQATAFAEGRAARLMSLMAGLGSTVTPSTVVAGSRLQDLLREANAIGAALDCTIAQVFSTGKLQTEKVVSLIAAWVALAGGYDGATYHCGDIEREIRQNTVSLATNQTLSGDTIGRDNSNPPQDVGPQITMTDFF